MAYWSRRSSVESDLRLADGELSSTTSMPAPTMLHFPERRRQYVEHRWVERRQVKHSISPELSGRNLNLARFPRLQTSRITADGVADFTVRASGTSEQPSIEAHIHLKDLAFDKERAEISTLTAVTHGRAARSQRPLGFDRADLTIRAASD